jgi:hypothetical protein
LFLIASLVFVSWRTLHKFYNTFYLFILLISFFCFIYLFLFFF